MTVRDAVEQDAAAIFQLNSQEMGYSYDEGLTCRQLRRLLALPWNRLWVAEQDGRVVGYIHAADYECTYAPPLKNLLALAVDSRCQKQGIGRLLMNEAEAWAQRDGAAGIRLTSGLGRSGAHAFYTACGYTHRKESKNFVKYL